MWHHKFAFDPTLYNRSMGLMRHQLVAENQVITPKGRANVIAYLRENLRSNPVLASIFQAYTNSIGSPKITFRTPDFTYNDLVERYLEETLGQIWGSWDLKKTLGVITSETLLAECFVVFTDSGKVELIPGEMIGSHPDNNTKREVDGVGYDSKGNVKHYRIGVRNKNGQISYSHKDGSYTIPAKNVKHLCKLTRIEQSRGDIRLISAIESLQQYKDNVKAKNQQVKAQSALNIAITKDNPVEYAEMLANDSAPEGFLDPEFYQPFARSAIQDIYSGSAIYLAPGEKAELLHANINSADFIGYQQDILKNVCGTIGMPLSLVNGEWGNYSSSRSQLIRWGKTVLSEREDLTTYFIEPLINHLILRGEILGILPVRPNLKNGKDFYAIWPELQTVDGESAALESMAMIEAGLTSRGEETLKRTGKFVDEVDAARVSEAAQLALLIKREAKKYNGEISEEEIKALLINSGEAAQALKTLNEAKKHE